MRKTLGAALMAACPLVFAASAGQAASCAGARTQAEMTRCVGDDYKLADQTLNIVYDRLMKRLDRDDRTRLRDAQRAWLSFRDKHCAFVGAGSEGGSIQSMIVAGCLSEVTTSRAGQLAEQLYCPEGDMSCVR